jgi:NADH-quinone oxidoreductase subunit L
VLFMNRLYADELYELLGQAVMRLVHRFDKREHRWSP